MARMTYDEWKRKKDQEAEQKYQSGTHQTFDEWKAGKSGTKANDDIAPVTTTVQPEEEEERKWFQRGLFADGYQFGDITRTILGTGTDVKQDLIAGGLGIAEGTVDTFASFAPYMMLTNQAMYGYAPLDLESHNRTMEIVEEAKESSEEFIKQDLIDEEAVANWMLQADAGTQLAALMDGGVNVLTDSPWKAAGEYVEEDMEERSVLGAKSDALVQSGGQLLTTAGLTALGVPAYIPIAMTSYGGEVENALKNGATMEEAMFSGAVTAGAEILSEMLFSGISLGMPTLEKKFGDVMGRISNRALRTGMKLGLDIVGEGSEEVISQFFSNLGSAIYRDESVRDILFSEEAGDEYWESFIGGAVLGGVSGGTQAVNAKVTGTDYATGLTNNEQAVVQTEYNQRVAEAEEDKGGKLTNREKNAIYEQVVEDMDKGRISTDTIEQVLGGDTYKAYQDAVESEDAQIKDLEAQIRELEKAPNTVGNSKKYDALTSQLDELKSKSQREQIKTQLGENVFGLVQNDRLVESYNERGRRSQAFEADLTQYDAKYHATIQNAIDSGILNNTNRTHEFVDMIAKISADKGVPFDFTNNTKLKDSSFALDGAAVNGYVTKDGITLNIDSAKALNSVVGHEITHVLEGTELYAELQTVLFEYAKSKGDYQGRYDALTKLYKDVKDANVDAELTADLVGDYLFSDADFVRSLSVQHRNVFQKLWDEIKYLCKVATAGSKEAKELAKVQKLFADVYREGGKQIEGTKYSLAQSEGVAAGENLWYNGERGESYARTDEFRNLQAESQRMSDEELQAYRSGERAVDETLRRRLSRVLERQVGAVCGSHRNGNGLLRLDSKGSQFNIYEDANGSLFHDCFEIARNYLENGELVDLHTAETTEDGIGYNDCYNYLSEDGLSGFSITPDGDLISVFNASGKKGFLRAIAPIVKEKAKTLDCYASEHQPLMKMYSKIFGFKTASVMDYNMEYDHDNIAKNHNYPKIAFMVNSENDVETRAFTKDEYDEAVEYRNSFVTKATSTEVASFMPKNSDPDIRYSLSDSNGRQLSPAVQNRFGNSKVVDEDGNLKVVYHGTAAGEFSIFDKSKGSVEGDYGSGFYFTDNEADVSEHYEDGGPDFDNKVARLAEQIEAEEEIDYAEAEQKAREQLYKGGHRFEVYLNIENPAIVGETMLFDPDDYFGQYDEADYDSYEDYESDVEQYISDEVNNIIWEIERNVDVYSTDGISEILWEAVSEGGIGLEELKAKLNNLYLEDSNGNLVANEVARQIIESLGYDGIIDPTVSGKWNMDMEEGTTHYIVFKPNQIKSVTNENPTDNPDIHRSLSNNGEEFAPRSRFDIFGRDIAKQEAPVAETPTTEATVAENATDEAMFPDDLAPMPEDENTAADRLNSLTDEDAPPEAEAPYTETGEITVDSPFEERDYSEMGNRKVKAYMYENPEVKPFFQEAAKWMLSDLQNSIKGEKNFVWGDFGGYGAESYYRVNATKRSTTDDIAYLLDGGDSYEAIEKGLKAIIEDNGAENNAVSKRIEFALNDRLMYGYRDIDGMQIPADEDYIKLLNEKQITEYSKEAFDAYMASADTYAPAVEEAEQMVETNIGKMPLSEYRDMKAQQSGFDDYADMRSQGVKLGNEYDAEDIAPVAKEASTAIRPRAEAQPKMARATPEEEARANVLVEEPKAEKRKSGAWARFKNNVLDKGMVFEDLSLKTGNRELQARWNSIRYAAGKAQNLIGKGSTGVSSLNSIRETVERSGKTQQFYEYLYHLHNADRMSLEGRYKDTKNKPVFGNSVTAEISRDAAAKLEAANPEFKKWSSEVYGYMNHLRQMLVDGGVISNKTAALWAEMYPHYVPIRRLGDEGLNINVPLDTGRTGVNAPIKRAKGGNRDILPLFDTMGQRTLQTYKAVAKNRFGVELKNTLGTTIDSEALGLDEAIDSIDTQDGLLQEGKNGRKPTFTVFENGEKVTFEITDEMYDAMKPTSDLLSGTSKVLNTVSNVRRGVLTEYNPWFLLKNAVKDVQDVLINSQHSAKTYAAIPKAIKEMATNGHWYSEYLDNGGDQNTYFDSDTNTFETENATLARLKKLTGLEAISKANNIIERLPRLAEYIASREAGRSIDVAMLDAARVTTNFAAGGDVTKFLNRNGATFLNASVQGAMQQARNIREAKMNGLKGWASLAGKFAVAGIPALILNNLIWDDDEEYEELSDYVKQNYYIVGKYGDGKFVRIPKGRTVAVIQNAIEQISNAATGDDEVDMAAFLDLLITNLAPNNPLDNNILSPIMDVAKNETWYGEDLVPTRLQDLPAAEQYDESTDSISRWLGETFNVSPYKVNYLLDQYGGVVSDTFLPMLTPEAESGDDSFLGNMIAPLKDMFTTDSVMKNQNVSDFYTKKDELTVNANASGATDEDVLMSKYMNSVNAEMAELYAQKREIQNSNIPDSMKYEQVRNIQRQIDELAENALNTYEGISYEDDYREGGVYARVGDRVFTQNDEGEWQKLSDEQLTKYEVTRAAGDAAYATDGTNHYRWYVPGEDAAFDTEAGWRKITKEQLERQREVTSGLGISPEDYWENKEEYDYAYEYPENYAVARAAGGYASFRDYSSALYDIKADKDEYGKSISGSRKEKVIDWLNELDADYGVKLILFKNEYNADDTYNYEIIEYLNGREDLSYEDIVAILKGLGFNVSDDGYVTW